MICVYCADYYPRFSSVPQGFHINVLDEIFSNDKASNVIAAEPSLRNEQEALKLESWHAGFPFYSWSHMQTRPFWLQHAAVTWIHTCMKETKRCSRILSNIHEDGIFKMRTFFCVLMVILRYFDSTSYSTVMHAHWCNSQDYAGRLLSAWKCHTLWAYKQLIGKGQTNIPTQIRVLLYTKP